MDELIRDALAVYRLWKLASQDLITAGPRRRFERWAEDSDHLMLRELLECPWCLGLWLAGAAVLARQVAPKAWNLAASILAVSAIAGALAEAVKVAELQKEKLEG